MTATLYRSDNKKRGWGFEAYPLEDRHKQAVELLAAGLTTATVGDCLGVTGQTIINWKRNPTFKKELAELIGVDAELHKSELVRLYGKSMERVNKLLDSKNEHIVLQAARLVMEAHQATVRLAEEQEMLQALERRMDELQAAAANGVAVLPPEAEDAEFEELAAAE